MIQSGFLEIEGRVVLAVFETSGVDVAEPGAALGQGRAFLAALEERFAAAYPGDAFELVLTSSDSIVARFYKVREGQAWLVDDLDSYGEAILAFTTAS